MLCIKTKISNLVYLSGITLIRYTHYQKIKKPNNLKEDWKSKQMILKTFESMNTKETKQQNQRSAKVMHVFIVNENISFNYRI